MSLRLAPKPLEIGPLDGFSKSDIFEAAQTGERLANIVSDLDGHSVLVLDGPWGTGKSVFVQQWAGLLRTKGHPVVYFDAFAHDHLDDAFFPLLSELLRAQVSGKAALAPFREKLIERAAPLARAVPALLTDLAVRTATAGVVSVADVREASGRSEAKRLGSARVMTKECLDLVGSHMGCVREFRAALVQAISRMDDDDGKPPLVFIIDELDRCRPTYALSVLERMKHIFDVDGVCFVLVTHLAELTAMVQRAYGLIDADSYLEKFYHRRFDFTKLLMRGSEKLRRRYLDHLGAEFSVKLDPNHFATITIDNLTRIHEVNLRGQERIMLNYALLRSAMPTHPELEIWGRDLPAVLGPGLAAMRYVNRDLFGRASSQNLKFVDARDFLKIREWINFSDEGKQRLERCWNLATTGGLKASETQFPREYQLQLCREYLADACTAIDQLAG